MIKGVCGALCVGLLACGLQATTVVIGQPPVPGSGNCDPFSCPAFLGLGTYQQVYASASFTAPLNIAQVTFYNFQVINNGGGAQGSYILSFAYTSKAPGMLDLMNPANNITSGSQVFFTGVVPSLTPISGGRQLTFTGTTFPYDPIKGNLLLTVTVSGPVDAHPAVYLDEATSAALTSNAYFGTVKGKPVSGGNDIGGLVTALSDLPLAFLGPASLPPAAAGVSYPPVTLLATGGTGGFAWSATGLPSGLSVSSAGVLSGTPALGTKGTYTPAFTVTDSSSNTATATLTLTVSNALVITGPSSLPSATVGMSYSPVTFMASGGSAMGYIWSATGLPAGLIFSTAGMLTGQPATGSQGSYNPQFTVTDSLHNMASVTLPLTINPPALAITGPTSLPNAIVGTSYTPVTFTASGGSGSGYTWAASGLPAGLSLTLSGTLSGIPATGSQGSYNPQFTVTDSAHNSAGVMLPLTVNPALAITGPSSLPTASVGVAYTPVTFTATGGSASGYVWSATGLPGGLSISSAGVLAGTPAMATQGTYSPQFTVTDSSHDTASVTLALAVSSNLRVTFPTALPIGAVNEPYPPVTFRASGGTGAGYTWSATGLPSGITISPAGVLSGTSTILNYGIFTTQFTVTDSSLNTASATLKLQINPRLSIAGPIFLPSGQPGIPYGPVTFSATGGTGTDTWSAKGLPQGLRISTQGVLSGTPSSTSSGIYLPLVTVKDSGGGSFTLPTLLIIN